MSYVKPGVEITQVQKTVGPTLNAPTLFPAVIGPAYKVVDLEDGDYFAQVYNSGLGTDYNLVTEAGLDLTTMKVDTGSIYVDLYYPSGITGAGVSLTGTRKHITTITTTNVNTNGIVTVPAGHTTMHGARALIGYRALMLDKNKILTFDDGQSVSNQFGEGNTTSLNPLGLAVSNALANAGNKQVYGFGLAYDDLATLGSGVTADAHTAAKDAFSTKEMYVYAVVSNSTTELDKYITAATDWSAPTEKKERIAVLCHNISWSTSTPTTSARATDAQTIADSAAAQLEKRATFVFPDTGYILENSRHIYTLSPTYVQHIYGLNSSVYAILAQDVTLSENHPTTARQSTKIYKGTEIDSTIYAVLLADPDVFRFSAYVPIHNAVTTASIAGQIAGLQPEQPLTNVPLRGISRVKFSSDWFTETNLNTIAQGGNYILTQSNPNLPVVCRHQLTTDMTTIQTRELNILKTIDYTAKFIRNTISPYIGRRVIDDQFLAMLSAVINAIGQTLVKDGHLSSFTLASLTQDTVNQDTIRCTINIVPKYPVNYIKIDLVF